MTLLQELQPMAAQLSLKAARPLAAILTTASNHMAMGLRLFVHTIDCIEVGDYIPRSFVLKSGRSWA